MQNKGKPVAVTSLLRNLLRAYYIGVRRSSHEQCTYMCDGYRYNGTKETIKLGFYFVSNCLSKTRITGWKRLHWAYIQFWVYFVYLWFTANIIISFLFFLFAQFNKKCKTKINRRAFTSFNCIVVKHISKF